jgi:hypothetical protein
MGGQIVSKRTFKGIFSNGNPLTNERGTLETGTNVVFKGEHVLTPRLGFDRRATKTAYISSMFEYGGVLFSHDEDGVLEWRNSGTDVLTSLGTFDNPGDNTIRNATAKGNNYFTTSEGIYKQSDYTDTPVKAGIPLALDAETTLTTTGGGFLSGDSQVAYRICWRREDGQGLVLRSSPSQPHKATNSNRVTVTITRVGATATATSATAHGFSTGNTILVSGAAQEEYNGSFSVTVTGATTFTFTVTGSPVTPATGTISAERKENVSVTFTVPAGIVAGDQYEVYRTTQSATAATSAGDTMYLVSREKYTAGATVTFVDTLDDDLLGDLTLYTNSNEEGIGQANDPPPQATDTETFQKYTFFSSTRQLDSLDAQLITASGSLVAGTSSISIRTIDGAVTETYFFSAAENIVTKNFLLATASTPSVNIENTVRSLVRVINRQSGGSFYAEYTSSEADTPGSFRIWSRTFATGQFYITVNASGTGDAFEPTVPTSGTTYASDDQYTPNRIHYSKADQPDHCPSLVNFVDVGRKNEPVERVIALRDALFALTSGGIWYTTDLAPPFTFRELDKTSVIISPDSAVALSNEIYMLSTQGFVRFSEAGVAVISDDITPDITPLIAFANARLAVHAVAHEVDRQYICYVPGDEGDSVSDRAWVYDSFRQAWTFWDKPASFSWVLSSDRTLYTGGGLEPTLLKQRRTHSASDYQDETVSATILTVTDSETIRVQLGTTIFGQMDTGWGVQQGSHYAGVESATLVSGTTDTFDLALDRSQSNFTAAACTVLQPISTHIRLPMDDFGEAGIVKTFQDVQFIPKTESVSKVTVEVINNEIGEVTQLLVIRDIGRGWGSSSWGSSAWGDAANRYKSRPYRVNVPLDMCTGEMLSIGWKHSVALESFDLLYGAVVFVPMSEITNVDANVEAV